MSQRALTAVALSLAAAQLSAPLAAQVTPPPNDPPVAQTQAPEDQATAPLPDQAGALPPPQPRPQPTAGAPAGEKAKPAKWDVNAPRGLRARVR